MLAVTKILNQFLIIAIVSIFFIGCSTTHNTSETPIIQEKSLKETNKTIIVEYLTALGTPPYPQLRGELLAENHVRTRQEFENIFYNANGDDELMANMQGVRAAFPDRKNTVTRLLGQGDKVAATFKIEAVHSGNLFGIEATGKPINIDAAAVFKLKDGKIIEEWIMADEAALLRQLGVKLPARQDGKLNVPAKIGAIHTFDDALKEHMTNPLL